VTWVSKEWTVRTKACGITRKIKREKKRRKERKFVFGSCYIETYKRDLKEKKKKKEKNARKLEKEEVEEEDIYNHKLTQPTQQGPQTNKKQHPAAKFFSLYVNKEI
jgi:hypothetical protein